MDTGRTQYGRGIRLTRKSGPNHAEQVRLRTQTTTKSEVLPQRTQKRGTVLNLARMFIQLIILIVYTFG